MKKVFYITNIFPFYRKPIWELLLNEKTYNFHFYFSNENLNGIKAVDDLKNEKLHLIKNYFFFGRIIWQGGVIEEVIKKRPDKIILLGEMNVISNWVLAFIGRLLKIKVYYWGHGIYGNENFVKRICRILFIKLAYGHILYGERVKATLLANGIKKENLYVVYNSLNYYEQKKHFEKLLRRKIEIKIFKLIFIGRLTKIKKIDQLLKALAEISNQLKYELIIVGDGPEKSHLKNLKNELRLSNIKFLGSIYDEKVLSELIFYSNICVSPGNVGLSAIHSLSYGTPVITHNDFKNQMPEVEAIEENISGLFFEKDNINDLAKTILYSSMIKFNRIQVRGIIDEKFNVEYQKNIFDKLILN